MVPVFFCQVLFRTFESRIRSGRRYTVDVQYSESVWSTQIYLDDAPYTQAHIHIRSINYGCVFRSGVPVCLFDAMYSVRVCMYNVHKHVHSDVMRWWNKLDCHPRAFVAVVLHRHHHHRELGQKDITRTDTQHRQATTRNNNNTLRRCDAIHCHHEREVRRRSGRGSRLLVSSLWINVRKQQLKQ